MYFQLLKMIVSGERKSGQVKKRGRGVLQLLANKMKFTEALRHRRDASCCHKLFPYFNIKS